VGAGDEARLTSSLRCSPWRRPRAGRRPPCGGAAPRAWRPRSASTLCREAAIPPPPVWLPPRPHLGGPEAVRGGVPPARPRAAPGLCAPWGLRGAGPPARPRAAPGLCAPRGLRGAGPPARPRAAPGLCAPRGLRGAGVSTVTSQAGSRGLHWGSLLGAGGSRVSPPLSLLIRPLARHLPVFCHLHHSQEDKPSRSH